jgi:hypothetical protein
MSLVIRHEQLQALETSAERAFQTELFQDLKRYGPKLCAHLGDLALQPIVASQIKHSRSCGLTRRGPIWLFVELTCTLGSGFDTDPQLFWASETLNDQSIPNDMLRAEQLYQRFVMYLDLVAGTHHRYAIQALRRWLTSTLDQPSNREWDELAALQFMNDIYPEKFEFIGPAIANTLIKEATSEASGYELPPGKGAAMLAAMKLTMGHHICKDIYYPWISTTLDTQLLVTAEDRFATLLTKLRGYFTYLLN